ncbi:hypothetical protein BH11PLA2_BH11PLA2_42060 [soil metagenome]
MTSLFRRDAVSTERSVRSATTFRSAKPPRRGETCYPDTVRSLAIVLLLTLPLAAQPPEGANVRGDSPTTRKRLAEAEQLLINGKPAEARDAIFKVIDEAGDDLIHTGEGRHVPARRFAQTLLGKLPSDLFKAYRDKTEPAARKLLDNNLFQQVLDLYPHSDAAGEALRKLGDAALEQGEFALAAQYWQRLLPDAKPEVERYTGLVTDVAAIRARIALATLFQGDLAKAAGLTKELAAKHPEAAGHLAGQQGKYADILRTVIENPISLPKPLSQVSDWKTLGGSPSRCGHVPGSLIGTPSSPTWTQPLTSAVSVSNSLGTVRRVGFHGVMDDRYLYVAQAGQILAFDLNTGAKSILFDIKSEFAFVDKVINDWQDADFTLTLANGHLYARVGPAAVLPRETGERASPGSVLIRLDAENAGDLPNKVKWVRKPPVAAGAVAGWEGAPLVIDGHVLAAFTRLDGGRVVTAIAAYDDRSDTPIWVTDVCEIGSGSLEKRERQELLTQAGRNVVFASQTGVITAVNTTTGKPAWICKYPRVKQPLLEGRHRDLSPPVAADGRVFVAPNDTNMLYAFDADSGRPLWQSGPIVIDHLLGVADGKVIATIAGPQRGLRAYNATTGEVDWQNHDDPGLASFGRGVIVGNLFAWPTQHGLHFVRVSDGTVARIPLPGPQGNLAYAAGRLAVIAPKEVRFFRLPDASLKEESPAKPIVLLALPRIRSAVTVRPPESLLLPIFNATPTLRDISPNQPSTLPNPLPLEVTKSVSLGNGSRVVRLGEHHLACVNDTTGEPVWLLNQSLRRQLCPHVMPNAPRYDEHFFADHRFVIARRSDRKVLFINSENGNVLYERGTDAEPWLTPPQALEDNSYAFSDGSGRVIALSDNFHTHWTYDAGRPASFAGPSAQLQCDGRFVNVIVHRNHGLELDRLRGDNGKPLWASGPAFLGDHGERIMNAVSDKQTLFVPGRDRLTMVDLDTGRVTKEVALPEANRWRLHRVENALIALPMGFVPPPVPRPDAFLRHSFVNIVAVAEPDLPPILILDHETGAIRHRLPTPGVIVASNITNSGLEVATQQRLYRIQ